MPEQALTVGRMVYYKARGSADGVFQKVNRAAVVTDVRTVPTGAPGALDIQGVSEPVKTQARLCVFNPDGIFHSDWLDQGQEGGQWDWMPFQKDQQARMASGGAALGCVAIGKMADKAV